LLISWLVGDQCPDIAGATRRQGTTSLCFVKDSFGSLALHRPDLPIL
jgi:hypothetical protein